MGLFDKFRQRASEERRESRIEFLGEQDGIPERGLKSALIPILATDATVARAYLVRVAFQPPQSAQVALCLAGPTDPSPIVLQQIQTCFAGMFRANAALDIFALSAEHESDAQRVCSPFYVRAV